ncbi:YbfB/YjiJ family MFS transporter [Breoghania sp.]|uniref:YbfB/YjiJ family MFS transporter n=1 Tax=Breoghania sp. TaxID=2065378 RepID=UPI0029CA9C64|nr:YbfB/YjiJ family MFS transporter [Breoghania sp.]
MSQVASPSPTVFPVAIGGLCSLVASMGIARFMFTPILPFMVEDAGLTPGEGGLIASANFLAYMIGALAAASGRLNALLPGDRRTIFLSAIAVSAITTAAMGLFGNVAIFMIIRFISGLSSAYVLVFGSALVMDRINAAGRPGLVALYFSGVGFGMAGSALLVAGLAAAGADWRTFWYAGGLVTVALLAVCAVLVDPAPEPRRSRPTVSARPSRQLVALYVSYGLFGFGYVITTTFISTMARMSPALSPYETEIWAALGFAAIPSVALWVAAARRIGNARTYALACLVEACGVALTVVSDSGLVVVVGGMMVGGTFIAITAVGLMQARLLTRGDPQASVALMTASFGLGQMVGPTIAGLVHDVTGSFTLPSLAAATALVVASGLAILPFSEAETEAV